MAVTLREWTTARGEPGDQLLVPSFILGDPWTTLNLGAVPFWTFFPVEPALRSLDEHLDAVAPYRRVDVLMFQHGADSPGVMRPDAVADVIRRHGATPRLVALRPRASPHDIGSLGRYGPVLARMPRARHPWSPLAVDQALEGLRTLLVTDGS